MHSRLIRKILAIEAVRISDNEGLSLLKSIDPKVSHRIGQHGHGGTMLFLAGDSVWKITDVQNEVDVCNKLIGKRTKTLVEIREVVDLKHPISMEYDEKDDYQSDSLWGIKMERLQELSPQERSILQSAYNLAFRDIDDDEIERNAPAINRRSSRPEINKAIDWLTESRKECRQYGAEEHDIFGYESPNVMKNSSGDWKRIDL